MSSVKGFGAALPSLTPLISIRGSAGGGGTGGFLFSPSFPSAPSFGIGSDFFAGCGAPNTESIPGVDGGVASFFSGAPFSFEGAAVGSGEEGSIFLGFSAELHCGHASPEYSELHIGQIIAAVPSRRYCGCR